jgi:hypothetical protein
MISTLGTKGQQEFLLRFFDRFHRAHDELANNYSKLFSPETLFDECYMSEVLALGLPHDFETHEDGAQSKGSGGDQSNIHVELRMLSNLKMFY